MRGGTSRGPYMQRKDLPQELNALSEVLVRVIGSGHPLNIDGIGGGASVTTKVAMLSPSDDDWADIDYFFAQVSVLDKSVDYKPTCGNILSGVGPAAIEMGLLQARGDTTTVRIRAVNTNARVEALVQTPGGHVEYAGDAQIDGVPGTAAPIMLTFMDVQGSATGSLLPTGAVRDIIDDVEVTCMDVAMPTVIARADAFGLSGHETADDLNKNEAFMKKMLAIRMKAGTLMGLGDVSESVEPKFCLIAAPKNGGNIAARDFTPWTCHPSIAVTGSQCLAACLLHPGTVADGLAALLPQQSPASITIEHPSGIISLVINYHAKGKDFTVESAEVLRTARLLARGELII